MVDWKILNKAETDSVMALVELQWSCRPPFPYAMLRTPKDKIYIATKELIESDFSGMRLDRIGIYFGELLKGQIRLSIEGSQIVGPHAKDNIAEVSKQDMRKWLAGQELDIDAERKGFQIVKCGTDFLGCGKASNGRLYNYVPKNRRLGSAN